MDTPTLTILFSYCFCLCCYGEQITTPEYHIQQFTDENGLPQNSVKDLAFDNLGFVWAATEAGLVRFDGRKFSVFNKRNLKVSSERFTSFVRDCRKGTLLGSNQYGQLVHVASGTARPPLYYVQNNQLEDSMIAPLWRHKFALGLNLDTTRSPLRMPAYFIIPGTKGRYCLFTDQKIIFFQENRPVSLTAFKGIMNFERFPSDLTIHQMAERSKGQIRVDNFLDINGQLFYHSGGSGTNFLKITGKGTERLLLKGDIESHKAFPLKKQHIRILWNPTQNQTFAYLEGSIYLVYYVAGHLALQTRLLLESFDLEENLITCILYQETDRTLFMGSITKGLFVFVPKLFKTLGHGNYYAHLPYQGPSVITPRGDILAENLAPFQEKDAAALKAGIPAANFTMLRDRSRYLWARRRRFVSKFTADGKKQIKTLDLKKEPVRLYQGLDKGIWIGFKDGQLSYWEEAATDSVTNIVKVYAEITFLYQDVPGQIWIGTSKGLYHYNLSRKKFTTVQGLDQKDIRSIYSSRVGTLWVTTYGDGIFLLENNRPFRIPSDVNGFLDHAHCIMEDREGYMWISTNKGLFQAYREDLARYANGSREPVFYLHYDKRSGFLTNEFNGGCQPCATQLEDGRFSFPSLSGLVWFDPAKIQATSLERPFVFENLDLGAGATVAGDSIGLPYNFKFLGIGLGTPFYGNPNNLEFYYSLENTGSAGKPVWRRADKQQRISIFNLSPGDYLLTVRKTTGFDHRGIEKKLLISVAMPWFFQWWFIAVVTAVFMLAFWLYGRLRLRLLRRQNAILSQRVEERTGHLSKALNDLQVVDQALQDRLRLQMRIISVINHDLHSPLKYLLDSTSRYMQQTAPLLKDPGMVGCGNAIIKSTQKIYLLTDELLKFVRATYNTKGRIKYQTVNVSEILSSKAAFFSEIAIENKTPIIIMAPGELLVKTNRPMLEIIVHNLLDNALKYTLGDTITLSACKPGPNHIRVSVIDTGMGMPAEMIDWLNSALDKIEPKPGETMLPVNLGLGLIIIKETAELLGIQIHAQSGHDGTAVHLDFYPS